MARKFLFVSLEGLIGDTAWAVAKEGHDVKYFIANEEERQIADGSSRNQTTGDATPTGPT
jgi:hypothetical protein